MKIKELEQKDRIGMSTHLEGEMYGIFFREEYIIHFSLKLGYV